MAANIFNGAVNSDWSTAGNWSLVLVPSSADGNVATFDATSPACTVSVAARTCNGINFTGYTNTISLNYTGTLNVTGAATFGSGMTIAGTGGWSIIGGAVVLAAGMTITGTGGITTGSGNSTFTSNGVTWPNALTLNGALTHTLADSWTVTGLTTLGSTSSTTTINGSTLTANGGVTFSGSSGIVLGTTVVVVGGGTITGQTTSGQCRLSLTITAAASTVTFAATPFNFNTGTLTATLSGSVVTTGSTLVIGVANTTLACAGITWSAATISGAFTHTLNENLNVAGLFTPGATTGATVINGSAINCSGGLRLGVTTGSVSGTTVINLVASQTVDSLTVTSGRISNPITINAPGGTVNIDAPFTMEFGKLLRTAGTVTTDSGTWADGVGGGLLTHPGMAGMRG